MANGTSTNDATNTVPHLPDTVDELMEDPQMTFGAVKNMATWEMLKVSSIKDIHFIRLLSLSRSLMSFYHR